MKRAFAGETPGKSPDAVGCCPVCGAAPRPLLSLQAQPIYQHPVPAEAEVDPPHTVDLCWTACTDCAHAWQPRYDRELLERIYRSHYYTPAPDGIAVQFRDDFLRVLEEFGLLDARRALLEIGASSGDTLAQVKHRTGAAHAYAYEPNRENAAVARQRGLQVRERFFGQDAASDRLQPVDLVYARHVIEHIFRFDDFFGGLNAVTTAGADLVLETPSLDHHVALGTFDPFHVEHVHVFSLRSLARLASVHGWHLQRSQVTQDGNLIAAFVRQPADGARQTELPVPALDSLQAAADRYVARMRAVLADRQLIFWGAGSAGMGLATMIGRAPDYWTDGNPGKVGKKFVGFPCCIVSPEEALRNVDPRGDARPVLVIASSFVKEILPRVRQLGWTGAVLDLAGKKL